METGLLSDDPRLADTCLKATAGYLSLYENQFGPYPFPKFAIVQTSLGAWNRLLLVGNGVRIDHADDIVSPGL
jgi:hypothetical protein